MFKHILALAIVIFSAHCSAFELDEGTLPLSHSLELGLPFSPVGQEVESLMMSSNQIPAVQPHQPNPVFVSTASSVVPARMTFSLSRLKFKKTYISAQIPSDYSNTYGMIETRETFSLQWLNEALIHLNLGNKIDYQEGNEKLSIDPCLMPETNLPGGIVVRGMKTELRTNIAMFLSAYAMYNQSKYQIVPLVVDHLEFNQKDIKKSRDTGSSVKEYKTHYIVVPREQEMLEKGLMPAFVAVQEAPDVSEFPLAQEYVAQQSSSLK